MDQHTLARQLREAINGGASVRGAARALGVSHGSARYALAKIKDKVRTADEFKAVSEFKAPRPQSPITCWGIEQIVDARNAQLRGDFKIPVQLAKIMATDDAIFTARRNRAAPQGSLSTRLVPASGARGERVAAKAARSVHVSKKTMRSIAFCLADHGIAIGYNDHEPSEDGTRIDYRLKLWPLEHVKWNEHLRCLETRVEGGIGVVPIVHGDGRWTIFAAHEETPWSKEAALLPAALVWGIHVNGLTDWAANSLSHGSARVIGELPAGVASHGGDGLVTRESEAFLTMLQEMMSGGAVAGIRPAGAKTDVLTNTSTQYEVFRELILSREKAAARIYLGTDAILGSVGGAPGIDIVALFAMATTIVQGDLEVLESGLSTGVYQPWCAVNEGDSTYAPSLKYNQPDPDAQAKSKENAEKRERFHAEIERLKKNGFVVDQPVVVQVAADIGLEDPPTLASVEQQTTSLVLAPTDVARVVRVREARASQGLAPFGDYRDDLTLPELEADAKARAEADAQIKTDAAAATLPTFTPGCSPPQT